MAPLMNEDIQFIDIFKFNDGFVTIAVFVKVDCIYFMNYD